jgi:DNA-binding MarR family transcriptional regulator
MKQKSEDFQVPFLKSIGACFMTLKRCGKRLISEKSLDLSMEQIMVLKILEIEEGLHLTQLAEKCDRDRTTMTRMVNGLERRNLVVKVPSKTDSRQKTIYLTHLAREKLMELARFADEIQRIALKGIDPGQVRIVREVLDRVTKNFEESMDYHKE